jgi:pyruvate dehydrogenase E2 component (dihydrolipoamide acetyltransferase)
MGFEFRLPDLGEGVHEAQILSWRVTPGEPVAAFQPLCEVESAKAAVELTAPVAGRVLETRFAEGAVAQRGDVLVVIETEPAGLDAHDYFGIVGRPSQATAASPRTEPMEVQARVRAAPFVRKMARERGIRLEDVAGSGPRGRVRLADLESLSQPPSTSLPPEHRTVPLTGLRRAIANHMVEAWRTAPQVTSMDLLDVTELVRARDALLASPDLEGVRLSYLPFFVKAAVQALQAVPEANAVVDEAQPAIILKSEYHIGVATAVAGGLVVPVVRNADRLSLLELAREIERLVSTVRASRATPADLSGGTFTITSFGGLPGSPLFATPILNYPEVAILGLGRIDLQPRVVNGEIVARQCIGASFTFDHRVLDGEAAGRFMAVLRRFLEQPVELLLHLH